MTSKNEGLKDKVTNHKQNIEELISTNKELALHLEEKSDELHKMLDASQKLSNMLIMHKSPLCKLGLGRDNCWGNFNKFNTFVKAYISSTCVGESSKQGAQLNDTRAFRRHHANKESIKPKHRNPKSRRVIH